MVSAVILIPCFWQPQIASADLASHAYNAWLTSLVEQGQLTGLHIEPQITNFAFDWLLVRLMEIWGTALAQRIAVSICVLVFFWGALSFVRSQSKQPSWHPVPILLALSYGLVFHLGLFNFYLSLGICLFALSRRHSWFLVPLLGLAFLAHALPVLWSVAAILYMLAADKFPIRQRLWLLTIAFVALVLLRFVIQLALPSRLLPNQFILWTGADQFLLFRTEYNWLVAAWLLLWIAMGRSYLGRYSFPRVLRSIPFQFVLLNAALIVLIPAQILPPGYTSWLRLIPERMSLLQGVLVCAWLAKSSPVKSMVFASVALVLAQAVMLYSDHGKLAKLEASANQALSALPEHARVLSSLCWSEGRFNAAYHITDRACIRRCFSYGNYEPSSAQFRLRADPGNSIVIADNQRASDFEYAEVQIREEEIPIYLLMGSPESAVSTRLLKADESIPPPCSQPIAKPSKP